MLTLTTKQFRALLIRLPMEINKQIKNQIEIDLFNNNKITSPELVCIAAYLVLPKANHPVTKNDMKNYFFQKMDQIFEQTRKVLDRAEKTPPNSPEARSQISSLLDNAKNLLGVLRTNRYMFLNLEIILAQLNNKNIFKISDANVSLLALKFTPLTSPIPIPQLTITDDKYRQFCNKADELVKQVDKCRRNIEEVHQSINNQLGATQNRLEQMRGQEKSKSCPSLLRFVNTMNAPSIPNAAAAIDDEPQAVSELHEMRDNTRKRAF